MSAGKKRPRLIDADSNFYAFSEFFPYWTKLKKDMTDFEGSDEDFVHEFVARVPMPDEERQEYPTTLRSEDTTPIHHEINQDLLEKLLNDPLDGIAGVLKMANVKTIEEAKRRIPEQDNVRTILFDAMLEAKNFQQEAKNLQHAQMKSRLQKWVDRTCCSSLSTATTLNVLSSLSTETKTHVDINTQDAKILIEQEQEQQRHAKAPRNTEVPKVNHLQPRYEILRKCKPYEDFTHELNFVDDLTSIVHDDDEVKEVTENLNALKEVYQAIFEQAEILKRLDDREDNKKFYNDRMKKATSYLDEAGKLIREKKMKDKKTDLVHRIKEENGDQDLVNWVRYLQDLRSWVGLGEKKIMKEKPTPPATKKAKGYNLPKVLSVDNVTTILEKEMKGLKLWVPGPTAQEVHGSQPIFGALLRALAECLPANIKTDLSPIRMTPRKGNIQRERLIPGDDKRKNRHVDLTLSKRCRYRKERDDYDVTALPIELKPLQRQIRGPDALQEESLNQGLAHAAKTLSSAMVLGPGFPAHTTFVTATILHVQVWKLVLLDPGTPGCGLSVERGDKLPLLSCDCFDKVTKSDVRHEADSFRESIYGRSGDNMINGMEALLKLMASSNESFNKYELPFLKEAGLLGSGAFGVVIGTEENQDHVYKLSRYNCGDELQLELKNLKLIQKKGEEIDDANQKQANPQEVERDTDSDDADLATKGKQNVVSLVRKLDFEFLSGGVPFHQDGLELFPRGKRPPSKMKDSLVIKYAKDLFAGLHYLHGCGLIHRDISYSNFVLYKDRAVIIDLATACPLIDSKGKRYMIDSFVGTPDFVHNDIHKLAFCDKKTVAADQNYDFAALAYTLCVLFNKGITPWKPIVKPCTIDLLEERNAYAEKKMKQLLAVDSSASDSSGSAITPGTASEPTANGTTATDDTPTMYKKLLEAVSYSFPRKKTD